MPKEHLNNVHLSKQLAWLLRHGAEREGFHVQPDGFLRTAEILEHPKYKPNFTHAVLEDIVQNDGKQRYTLRRNANSGEWEIRANQGHSIRSVESEACMQRVMSADQVPIAVHGTYMRHWDSIKREGLKPMRRNHVHFACTDQVSANGGTDALSGFRVDAQLLIYLDVEKALTNGMALYRSTNNVILCAGLNGCICKEYFRKVVKRRTGEMLYP